MFRCRKFDQFKLQFPAEDKAEFAKPTADERAEASVGEGSTRSLLQEALLQMVGKPTRELVAVDIGEKLAELGLTGLMPVDVHG